MQRLDHKYGSCLIPAAPADRTVMSYLYAVLFTLVFSMMCIWFRFGGDGDWQHVLQKRRGKCVGGSFYACCLSSSFNPEVVRAGRCMTAQCVIEVIEDGGRQNE